MPEKKAQMLTLRLDKPLADRLELAREQLAAREPGPRWSRSDVVRRLLAEGFRATGLGLPADRVGPGAGG